MRPFSSQQGAAGTAAFTAATPAPQYRRLYDAAMDALKSKMTLEPYPIPEGLESNQAVVGKGRNTQVFGYCPRLNVACRRCGCNLMVATSCRFSLLEYFAYIDLSVFVAVDVMVDTGLSQGECGVWQTAIMYRIPHC